MAWKPSGSHREKSERSTCSALSCWSHILKPRRNFNPIAEDAEVSVRTLQRWVVGYRSAGLAGLVKKERRDKGERRAVSPRLRDAIEGLALEKPALPLTSVHRQVKRFALMIGEAEPSYWVVRDIALSIPNDLHTLAQQGARRYGELYDLVHRREETRPNALWQADHAQLDILLLREDGAAARPWLTAIIDDHSRSIAGYYLSFDPPSSLRTSLALRQGIWRRLIRIGRFVEFLMFFTPTMARTLPRSTWNKWQSI